MNKAVAVLISDVHYNINTLKLADAAMRMAIDKANELVVPLIVAGDLHDTKANMRAECVDALMNTFSKLLSRDAWIIRGNHDSYNEKSDKHALSFLKRLAYIIDTPRFVNLGEGLELYFVPYHHDVNELRTYLKTIPKGATIIMHQGLEHTNAGHYIQDKSALTHADVCDFRVVSGHYHTRQDIITSKLGVKTTGMVGVFSYIGNPYTLGFGEANDPVKGFQILMDDGTLEFVNTNLRRHVIHEIDANLRELAPAACQATKPGDLLWIKVKGTKEELSKINRKWILERANLSYDFSFRLDLIPTDIKTSADFRLNLSQGPLFDSLIDSLTDTSDERKTRLKAAWKSL